MTDIHKSARQHFSKTNSLSGMPGQSEISELSQLHLNLNYFSDSKYIKYPQDDDANISFQFIDFLKKEALWKRKTFFSSLKPSNLLFISASNAIDLIVRTFCEPVKDSVCITSPTFPLYGFCANNNNSPLIDVPLEGHFLDRLNVPKIIHSNAKVLFIPIPNNPIGNIPDRWQVLELLNGFKDLIVLDEAYIEYSDEGSFIEYLQHCPNLIILRSFSKIWGHAGIRCGVVIASEVIINTLKKNLPPCFFPMHTQEILRIILEESAKILKIREETRTERQKLEEGIKGLPCVRTIYPSQTNFLLVEFVDGPKVYANLLQNGILVKNMHSLIQNTLRISLGKIEENAKIIQLLQEFNLYF